MKLLLAWVVAAVCVIGEGHAAAQLFRRPVACEDCISSYYFFDHGFTQDWNCSSSTYPDHLGSDYSLRGGNASIDTGYAVVAMAAGTVVSRQDGYYDRCTRCGGANCGSDFGGGFGNQVIIDHGAYTVTYGHMRLGSVEVKAGDAVTCGQVIGEIGSSGCSTGAHLHVEPRAPGASNPIDPYEGTCSPTTASLWVDQGAYRTMPSPTCEGEDPVPACPADISPTWRCNDARTERRRCEAGLVMTEPCPYGCTVGPSSIDDACTIAPDADKDGSRADVDCNDTNPAIHPGAIDECGDGVDQDCSGRDKRCATGGAGGASGADADSGNADAGREGGAASGDAGASRADAGSPLAGRHGKHAGGSTAPAPSDCCRASLSRDAGLEAVPIGPREEGPNGTLPLPDARNDNRGCATGPPHHGSLASCAVLALVALALGRRGRTARPL